MRGLDPRIHLEELFGSMVPGPGYAKASPGAQC
jgi:hypothetical protein